MIWPFKRKPQGDGPLFGLSPPEGMVFIVTPRGDGSFSVELQKLDGPYDPLSREITKGGCARKEIRKAALELLVAHEKYMKPPVYTWEEMAYSGEYPPKDTRNI